VASSSFSLRHRAAIDALLHRVKKAKAGLFELELAEAQASADRAQLPPPAVLPPSESPKDQAAKATYEPPAQLYDLMHLALSEPRRAIVETYHFVNHYAWEASQGRDPEQTRYTDGSPDVMRLAAVNLLAPKYADVLDRLRDAALRAQDPEEEVTPGQALDYVLIASRLVGFMAGRLGLAKPATES
jgi:hypothetical protein